MLIPALDAAVHVFLCPAPHWIALGFDSLGFRSPSNIPVSGVIDTVR